MSGVVCVVLSRETTCYSILSKYMLPIPLLFVLFLLLDTFDTLYLLSIVAFPYIVVFHSIFHCIHTNIKNPGVMNFIKRVMNLSCK